MMSRKLLALTLVALPMAAQAQRGGGGAPPVTSGPKVERGDRRASYNVDTNVPVTISDKDVESLSPVKVFLDKKKAKGLALTDEQTKQLKDMDVALGTQNDTLFKKLDSLRSESRMNKNATNPAVEQLRVRGARTAMVEVIKSIRENYDKAEPGALGVLTEAQKKEGSDLLDKHQKDAEDMLSKKLGASGGGRRGPG